MPLTGTVVGEGPDFQRLKHLVDEYYLDNQITFKGSLPMRQVQMEFDKADIFVLPCITASNGDRDGIPNVILEAMAKGLPVISTNESSIPEVITDGIDGILVRPRDSEVLAHALRKLCRDRKLRNILGKNARKKTIDCFNKTDMIDKLLVLFLKANKQNADLLRSEHLKE
jgi:glycosyltransferase involved in cell wall biosynthesis